MIISRAVLEDGTMKPIFLMSAREDTAKSGDDMVKGQHRVSREKVPDSSGELEYKRSGIYRARLPTGGRQAIADVAVIPLCNDLTETNYVICQQIQLLYCEPWCVMNRESVVVSKA